MSKQRLGPNQLRWIRALESGRYKQGRHFLIEIRADVEYHCCLGVGCKIFRIPRQRRAEFIIFDGESSFAPESLVEKLALRSGQGWIEGRRLIGKGSLTHANDNGATFAEIAAFCRAYPEAVFSEPR